MFISMDCKCKKCGEVKPISGTKAKGVGVYKTQESFEIIWTCDSCGTDNSIYIEIR